MFEEADSIIVGKIIDLKEFPSKKETEYVIKVDEIIKPRPSHGGGFEENITVTAIGTRQYLNPSDTVIYPILFDIGDKALFFLNFIETDKNNALVKGKWEVLPYTFTTKGNCTGEQLLQAMFGPSGLTASQNNKTKPLYINQHTDLTFYVYNRDLISTKNNFEFQVSGPQLKISQNIPFQLEECKRSTKIKWSFVPSIPGYYSFGGIIGDQEGGSEFYSGVLIDIAPPQKQIKFGVEPINVVCRDGLSLLLKPPKFTSPVCVTDSTYGELADRGWILVGIWNNEK